MLSGASGKVDPRLGGVSGDEGPRAQRTGGACVALVNYAPPLRDAALAVATLGNTLGGLTSYLVGRLLPAAAGRRAVAWLARYGPAALLLSWVPVDRRRAVRRVGLDAPERRCRGELFMAAGKFARYWALAEGIAWWPVAAAQCQPAGAAGRARPRRYHVAHAVESSGP